VSETPASPIRIESVVRQRESYDEKSTFAQTSAASVAASSAAAPPVSVRRKERSGVGRLRAHAVRPEKAAVRAGAGRLSSVELVVRRYLPRRRGRRGSRR
jgi:hypothetical protein